MTGRNDRGDTGHLGVMTGTATTLGIGTSTCIFNLTNEQGHAISTKVQVGQHVIIDFLHHAGPVGVATVRASLMKQDTLDDTHLLCLLGHLNDTSVRITAIMVLGQRSPPITRMSLQLLLIQVLVKHLNRTTTHSYGNHTDTDTVGQRLAHHTTEIIGRTKSTIRADQWRRGLVPVAFGTQGIGEVTGGQQAETIVDTRLIYRLWLGISFHV